MQCFLIHFFKTQFYMQMSLMMRTWIHDVIYWFWMLIIVRAYASNFNVRFTICGFGLIWFDLMLYRNICSCNINNKKGNNDSYYNNVSTKKKWWADRTNIAVLWSIQQFPPRLTAVSCLNDDRSVKLTRLLLWCGYTTYYLQSFSCVSVSIETSPHFTLC